MSSIELCNQNGKHFDVKNRFKKYIYDARIEVKVTIYKELPIYSLVILCQLDAEN